MHTHFYIKVNLLQNKYEEANAIAKTIYGTSAKRYSTWKRRKTQYLKYYSGEITNVKLNQLKRVNSLKININYQIYEYEIQ